MFDYTFPLRRYGALASFLLAFASLYGGFQAIAEPNAKNWSPVLCFALCVIFIALGVVALTVRFKKK